MDIRDRNNKLLCEEMEQLKEEKTKTLNDVQKNQFSIKKNSSNV